MKMTKNLSWIKGTIGIILMMFFAFFITACDESVDTSVLQERINEANAAKEGVYIAINAGDVPDAQPWVTQSVMNTFNNDIAAAELAKTTALLQAVVNTAVITLTSSIYNFNQAIQFGTGEPVNNDVLTTAIANANVAKEGVVTSTNGSNVPPEQFWVTSAVMTTFNTAINTAESVLSSASIQSVINNAANTLTSATTTFNNAKQAGTQGQSSTDYSALNTAIANANAAKEGVIIATNGADIPPEQFWVLSVVMTTFNSAISTAELALTATSQAIVNTAASTLTSATTTFNNAKQAGTQGSLDYSALDSAIANANAAKEGVVVAANPSSVAQNIDWVSSTVMSAFNTAIFNAVNSRETASTQLAINAAVPILNGAVTVFNSAKQKGTMAVNQGSVTITGLSDYYGGIEVYLISSVDNINFAPGTIGMGNINAGSAVVNLFDSSNGSPWIASGTWYVVLQVQTDNLLGHDIYTSKTAYNFSTTPNPAITLASFDLMTIFSISLGDFINMMTDIPFDNIIPPGTTINEFILMLTEETFDYSEFSDAVKLAGHKIGSNAGFTADYTGNEIATADIVIYTDIPFVLLASELFRGPTVGSINGTISLTNIPAGARIYISARGTKTGDEYSSWWSRKYEIKGFTGSSVNNVSWSIPIYQSDIDKSDENANCFDPDKEWTFDFVIEVEFYNMLIDKDYRVYVPTTAKINYANLNDNIGNAGNLGSVNIGYVSVNGSINVTYNGNPVPYIRFSLRAEGRENFGSATTFAASDASTNWEMYIPANYIASDSAAVRIYGIPAKDWDWNDLYFTFDLPIGMFSEITSNPVNINIGNLVPNTLRILNNPAGNYFVYITSEDNFEIENYEELMEDEETIKLNGTGPAVSSPLLDFGDERDNWKSILIDSQAGTRYLNNIEFYNGIAVIDWNKMNVLTP